MCRILAPAILVLSPPPSERAHPIPASMRSNTPTPLCMLLAGCVQVGIEMKFKGMAYPVIIAPTHVPEMNQVGAGHVLPAPS